MKKLRQLLGLITTSMMLVPITSCSDDDDINNDYGYNESIVGEWFTDYGIEPKGMKQVFTYDFKADGSFTASAIQIIPVNNWPEIYDGNYTIAGKRLRLQYEENGEKQSLTSEILTLNKYDFIVLNRSVMSEEVNHRIIETKYMKVGESDNILILNNDFIPESYSSNDELVATVSNTGVIKAIRQGTAYISIKSSIGTAVVRIDVIDPDTYVDNYLKFFADNLSSATKAYGDFFADEKEFEEGVNVRNFPIIDNKVRIVSFYYDSSNIVNTIFVNLMDGVDYYEILKAYDKQYDFLYNIEDSYFFRAKKYGRKITIDVNVSQNYIYYKFYDDTDPMAIADSFISMTTSEVAKLLGYTITEEEGSFIVPFNHPYFYGVKVYYTGEKITSIVFLSKQQYRDDIYGWYSQNYTTTGRDVPTFIKMNPVIYITIEESPDGDLYVWYNLPNT